MQPFDFKWFVRLLHNTDKQLHKIYMKRKKLLSAVSSEREAINQSLKGSLQAMKQISDA